MGKASLVSWVFKRIRDSKGRLSNDTFSILFQTRGVKLGTTARRDKDPTPIDVSFACPLRTNEKETQIFVLQNYIEASFGDDVKAILPFHSAIRIRPAFGIRFVPFVIPNGSILNVKLADEMNCNYEVGTHSFNQKPKWCNFGISLSVAFTSAHVLSSKSGALRCNNAWMV